MKEASIPSQSAARRQSATLQLCENRSVAAKCRALWRRKIIKTGVKRPQTPLFQPKTARDGPNQLSVDTSSVRYTSKCPAIGNPAVDPPPWRLPHPRKGGA